MHSRMILAEPLKLLQQDYGLGAREFFQAAAYRSHFTNGAGILSRFWRKRKCVGRGARGETGERKDEKQIPRPPERWRARDDSDGARAAERFPRKSSKGTGSDATQAFRPGRREILRVRT